MKKEFRLQEEDLQIDGIVKLYLGAIVDADIVYINGIKVGDTTFRYPPRLYEVDKSVLHEGINEIVIHMFVMRENGGFMPDKAYELVLPQGRHISLMGEWEAATVERMPYLPDMTFFQYAATGLYNGMLYPLRRQKIKGCFFYQGESNTGVADRYEQEFSAMIGEWRSLWNDPSLPFIYVQLAGFRTEYFQVHRQTGLFCVVNSSRLSITKMCVWYRLMILGNTMICIPLIRKG